MKRMVNMRIAFVVLTLVVTTGPVVASYPADPGSRGVDWDAVKAKVSKYDWARRIVERLRRDVDEVRDLYDHPPLGLTGWTHEYFCSVDAHRLEFAPKRPTEHVCPACRKIYSGRPYDDCWRTNVHNQITRATRDAAVLYRITGEAAHLDYVRAVLLWYADNYGKFEVHGEHAGKGRIGPQSLDEATLLVSLTQAYWDVCPFLKEDERSRIIDQFLLPDARFVHGQTRAIHNIHSWHNAAVGLVGFVAADKELVTAAIEGPFGLKAQIAKGIREDGFWYEGSTGYHFYTIQSMQPLYLAARGKGWDLSGTEKFLRMYSAPVRLAFSSGEFPALNDGWPDMNLFRSMSHYEVAAALGAGEESVDLLAAMAKREGRGTMEALLYGPAELPDAPGRTAASVLLEGAGLAILRSEGAEALMKYGPYGGGHDHNDRLNLIVFARGCVVVPDLGTSGYGISLNRWYRSPAAHNMLVVDGKRQANCGGYLVSYADDAVRAGVKEAYEGVDIQRHIRLADKGLDDVVEARSDQEHTYDLFYHVRGELTGSPLSFAAAEAGKGEGYDMLRGVRMARCEGQTRLTYKLRDVSGRLVLTCSADKPFELYVGTCPDNPADETLSVIIVRLRDKTGQWQNSLRME